MNRANEQPWAVFWSWFFRSARRDGATVSFPRRALLFLATLALVVALCAGWYAIIAKTQPKLARIPDVFEHPLCAAGIVLAFLVMNFRSTVLDYMAFKIYEKERVLVSEGVFGIERELRHRYEARFGKDSLYHAPEFVGGIAVLIFAISGMVLVFSAR